MAYWVVAGVGALSAALAWIAIVEPRALLRRAKVPAGAAPPRPALLAVLRNEVAGMLRDFWTVLKIPTFMVLMTEVPHPGLMQHTRETAAVQYERHRTAGHASMRSAEIDLQTDPKRFLAPYTLSHLEAS